MAGKNKKHGCTIGCAILAGAILLIITVAEQGHGSIAAILSIILFVALFIAKIRLINSYDPNAKDEPVKDETDSDANSESPKDDKLVEYVPDFEIRYRKSKNDETVRKISVVKLGEFLYAYCFLRNSICTFSFQKIVECVDLSTGEFVKDDLRIYIAKSRVKTLKPIELFEMPYWGPIRYSSFMELPEGISGFKVDDKFMMDVVTFKYGERKEEFVCKRVVENKKEADRFFVELVDSSNKKIYVGMNKIISVEGIEDFGEYLTEKFYESKADKQELT